MKELVLSGVQIHFRDPHSKDLGFSFQNAAQGNFYPLCTWLKIPIPASGESDWLSWAICSGHRVGII